MTLKEIHDGIEKAFSSKECFRLEGLAVIHYRNGRTWIEKEFLIKYRSIIRMILREIKEGVMEKEKIPMCCKIGCGRDAEVVICFGNAPDDYTESCLQHIGDLLTDAKEHRLYWIRKLGESEREMNKIILEVEPNDLKAIIEELEPSVQAENDSSEQGYWKRRVDYLREKYDEWTEPKEDIKE